MLGLVILLFLGCAVAVCASARGRFDPGSTGWRDALLWGLVLTGVWAAAGAEVLSLGSHFAFGPVLAWWAAPACGLLMLAWARRGSLPALRPAAPVDGRTRVLIGLTVLVLMVTGAIAALTPPNTYDSIQYHLPRMFQWAQRGSVAHFPTLDARQLEMPPLAEFIGAQILILTDGDRGIDMIQWFAFLGCAAAASLIARDLGAGTRVQAAAALLVVLNPAAATQAENAKNDLVVALWLGTLAYLAVRMCVQRACPPARVVMIGAALGLAMLTKGTGYILALPICVLVGVWALQQMGARALPAGAAMVLIASALNAGHWERNYRNFGNPLGMAPAQSRYELSNTAFTPPAIASNIVRNIALHTCTPWERVNTCEELAIDAFHRAIGADPRDPRTTFMPDKVPFRVTSNYDGDGNGPAPFHLLLALAALPLGLRIVPAGTPRRAAWFVFVPAAMFLAFCLVLKWQPWHARLHIPIVCALAPVAALALRAIPWGAVRVAILAGCTAVGFTGIVLNDAKPLVGPGNIWTHSWDDLAFHREKDALAAVEAAATDTAEYAPRVVAFAYNRLEYPVWRVFQRRLGPSMVAVSLETRYLHPARPLTPDAIVTWGKAGTEVVRESGGTRYTAVAQHMPVTVYVRSELVRGTPSRLAEFAFIGWTAMEGLDKPQGPFPAWNLPIVRWGVQPRTRLEFKSDGLAAYLDFECESNGLPGQDISISLNGAPVYRYEFLPGRGFTAHRVALSPRAGRNEIEMTYALGIRDARPANRAVLFSRLQVLPSGAKETP
ncbi:MAG: hypothetical protein IT437_13235 [Phycisphaerales bacterium]|nr:hypothetical protein [Phycisphaerales bacterium]